MYILCIYFGDYMKTRIQKWGNSLAVRIPKSFAEGLGLVDDSPAEMTLEEGTIVLKPDRDRVWDLGELLDGVTDDNLHPAWETEAAAFDDAVDPGGEGRTESGQNGKTGGGRR
jgi:antitoxin MazE